MSSHVYCNQTFLNWIKLDQTESDSESNQELGNWNCMIWEIRGDT